MPKRAKESESSEPEREARTVKVVDPLALDDSLVAHLIVPPKA